MAHSPAPSRTEVSPLVRRPSAGKKGVRDTRWSNFRDGLPRADDAGYGCLEPVGRPPVLRIEALEHADGSQRCSSASQGGVLRTGLHLCRSITVGWLDRLVDSLEKHGQAVLLTVSNCGPKTPKKGPEGRDIGRDDLWSETGCAGHLRTQVRGFVPVAFSAYVEAVQAGSSSDRSDPVLGMLPDACVGSSGLELRLFFETLQPKVHVAAYTLPLTDARLQQEPGADRDVERGPGNRVRGGDASGGLEQDAQAVQMVQHGADGSQGSDVCVTHRLCTPGTSERVPLAFVVSWGARQEPAARREAGVKGASQAF